MTGKFMGAFHFWGKEILADTGITTHIVARLLEYVKHPLAVLATWVWAETATENLLTIHRPAGKSAKTALVQFLEWLV
jgi:hypothetical protein